MLGRFHSSVVSILATKAQISFEKVELSGL